MFQMTATIVRNFFSKRATRRHPYEVRPPFAGARGAVHNDIAACDLCGICAAKCPSQCIAVDKKSATWQCDPFACICCGVCVEACKTGSLRQLEAYRQAATVRKPVALSRVAEAQE